MSKKTLIFGLVAVLAASTVAGAFSASSARADSYPYGGLTCSPSVQSANSGDNVSFSAYSSYGTYTNGQLTWSAVGGYPPGGYGQSFNTRFYTSSINETRVVTVTDGYQTATCTVYVNGNSSYTPTPTVTLYGYLTLDHTVRNVTRGGEGSTVTASSGDRLQFIARITTGSQSATNARITDYLPQYVSYLSGTTNVDGTWYVDGITTGGLNLGTLNANRTYTVKFDATYGYTYAGTMSSTNQVTVSANNAATQSRSTFITNGGYAYPTPSPTNYPVYNGQGLSVSETGRNVSRGQSGEYASVWARGGDTLDLVLHVRNANGSTLSNVYVTDLLPAGLNYVFSSTTLNGTVVGDGITSSGLNVGTLYGNQENTIKFSVTVDSAYVPGWGQVDVASTAQARADGANTVSATLPISLGQSYLATIARVKTGPADSFLLALFVSMLMTGIYAMYTRTELFGRRVALAEVRNLMTKGSPNFIR